MPRSSYSRTPPPKPSLGPLFLAAVTAWAVVVAVEETDWLRYVGEEGGWEAPALAVLVLAVCLFAFSRIGALGKGALVAAVPVAVFALCAFACASLYWSSWEASVRDACDSAENGERLVVDLVTDPSERDYGLVSEARTHIKGKTVRIRVAWPNGEEGLPAGHSITCDGLFRSPSNDEGGRWNHQQGFAGMLSIASFEDAGYGPGLGGWVAPLRDASMERIAALGGSAAGLLAGILLGNKTLYSGTELEQDFRVTGLAHLMAVSGTHLAVVTLISLWLLRRLPFGRKTRSLVLTLLLLAYVALTAFAPSAMRACAMCAVGLGASGFGRRRHVLSALSACVVVFLSVEPRLAFSVGFQLSVLCMVGLVLFSPIATAWLEALLPERFSGAAQGLAATLCANLVTMPVTVPLFCQLPLISPISTLIASPLVTAALALGVAGLLAYVAVEPLGWLLLHLAGAVASLCAWVVHFLACLPVACVPLDASASWLGILCALALFAVWVFWPLPGERRIDAMPKAVLAFSAPLSLVLVVEFGGLSACVRASGVAVESDAQVIMLDVGQGDAMVVRDGTAAVLVDTGEEGTVLLKALARNGIGSLDAVLLSHKDVDHTGALSSIVGVVDVRHVFMHGDLVGSQEISSIDATARRVTRGEGVEGVGVGACVSAGRFTLRLVAPQAGGASENEDSLIWLLAFDEDADGVAESKGLLTGDGEAEAIANVVEDVGDIAFLKVAHHGSSGAVTSEELGILRPELALISVGEGNEYGHPTKSTLSVLEKAGCRVVRTDLSGDVTLSFQGNRIGVSTQRKS